MITSQRKTAALLQKSIRTLEQEFEARQAGSQRPMPASVARAYRLAIEQRARELQRLQERRRTPAG